MSNYYYNNSSYSAPTFNMNFSYFVQNNFPQIRMLGTYEEEINILNQIINNSFNSWYSTNLKSENFNYAPSQNFDYSSFSINNLTTDNIIEIMFIVEKRRQEQAIIAKLKQEEDMKFEMQRQKIEEEKLKLEEMEKLKMEEEKLKLEEEKLKMEKERRKREITNLLKSKEIGKSLRVKFRKEIAAIKWTPEERQKYHEEKVKKEEEERQEQEKRRKEEKRRLKREIRKENKEKGRERKRKLREQNDQIEIELPKENMKLLRLRLKHQEKRGIFHRNDIAYCWRFIRSINDNNKFVLNCTPVTKKEYINWLINQPDFDCQHKNEICSYYFNNHNCTYAICNFAHSLDELIMFRNIRYKTLPCDNGILCRYKHRCCFTHGIDIEEIFGKEFTETECLKLLREL